MTGMKSMTGTMTYGSTDVETKANAHDVNLVVIGSRSMTVGAGNGTNDVHGDIRWHGSVDRVIHRNSGATSDAWLLDTAARQAFQEWGTNVVTVELKLDAEFILEKCQLK
jgi:hypothetical protein